MQPFQRGLFFFYSLYLWLLPDKFVHSYVTYIESWGVNAFCVEKKLQLQVSWTKDWILVMQKHALKCIWLYFQKCPFSINKTWMEGTLNNVKSKTDCSGVT